MVEAEMEEFTMKLMTDGGSQRKIPALLLAGTGI